MGPGGYSKDALCPHRLPFSFSLCRIHDSCPVHPVGIRAHAVRIRPRALRWSARASDGGCIPDRRSRAAAWHCSRRPTAFRGALGREPGRPAPWARRCLCPTASTVRNRAPPPARGRAASLVVSAWAVPWAAADRWWCWTGGRAAACCCKLQRHRLRARDLCPPVHRPGPAVCVNACGCRFGRCVVEEDTPRGSADDPRRARSHGGRRQCSGMRCACWRGRLPRVVFGGRDDGVGGCLGNADGECPSPPSPPSCGVGTDADPRVLLGS